VRRGDIFSVAGSGGFAGKPRPALVVQTDLFNPNHPSITFCPISSHLTDDYLYRIPIFRDDQNGLKLDSEIEVDKVQAVWLKRIGRHIGIASGGVMSSVDDALKRWFDI
jgi:mRNA interferase MazF